MLNSWLEFVNNNSSVLPFSSCENKSGKTNLGERILVNVGGTIFETVTETLNRYTETFLGTPDKCALLSGNQNQIFINRASIPFEAVLFYYQSSRILIRPVDMAMEVSEVFTIRFINFQIKQL